MGIATGQDGPGGWSVSISDENGESQKITLSQGGGSSIPILVENNEIFGTITVSLTALPHLRHRYPVQLM